MSYTPTNWQTGDTITAEKLNNIESGVENAQWKTEERTQLFSENVTTEPDPEHTEDLVAELAYSQPLDAPTIKVVFDGTEYTCNAIESFFGHAYGGFNGMGPDFTEYPFVIISYDNGDGNIVQSQTAGAHSVSASVVSVAPTDKFSNAVLDASKFVITFTNNNGTWTADKTLAECNEAHNIGKTVIAKIGIGELVCSQINDGFAYFHGFTINANGVTATGIDFFIDDRTGNDKIEFYEYNLQTVTS